MLFCSSWHLLCTFVEFLVGSVVSVLHLRTFDGVYPVTQGMLPCSKNHCSKSTCAIIIKVIGSNKYIIEVSFVFCSVIFNIVFQW